MKHVQDQEEEDAFLKGPEWIEFDDDDLDSFYQSAYKWIIQHLVCYYWVLVVADYAADSLAESVYARGLDVVLVRNTHKPERVLAVREANRGFWSLCILYKANLDSQYSRETRRGRSNHQMHRLKIILKIENTCNSLNLQAWKSGYSVSFQGGKRARLTPGWSRRNGRYRCGTHPSGVLLLLRTILELLFGKRPDLCRWMSPFHLLLLQFCGADRWYLTLTLLLGWSLIVRLYSLISIHFLLFR